MMFTRHAPLMLLAALVLLAGTHATAATLAVPGSYTRIQTAINGATTGDVVVVSPGTYHERLNFNGKSITVRSTAPTNPAVVAATIINGDKGGSVVTFNHAETSAAILSGFTLTNGSGTFTESNYEGAGIYTLGASPTITNNVITGNNGTFGGGMYCDGGSPTISGNVVSNNTVMFSGGGLYFDYASPLVSNNVITGNTAGYWGGGIDFNAGSGSVLNNTLSGNASTRYYGSGIALMGAAVIVRNSIITSATVGGGIYASSGVTADVKYCNVYGNTGGNYVNLVDPTGSNGNLSVDSLFANAAGGDFHEKSMAGRWNGSGWVGDPVTSPCVDAGDPASSYANEPAPNGSRVNMGAYGNTAYASKSGSAASPPAVVCATFVDNNHVNLLFTKALNAGTVAAVGNYAVTPSLGVTAATLDADTKTVHLTTAAQTLSTTYTVTVKGVKDTLGNAIVAGSGDAASWTPSAIVPTVIATLPTGTKVGAEKVTITTAFSTPMNKTSAQGALSLAPAKASGVAHGWPGTFVWVGNQMQYKLSTALAPLTTYKVTISTAAKSSGGAKLGSTKTWSFTTTATPAVASYSPTGTAVPRSTTGKSVRIAFNQPMNKASVQGALWLYPASATPSATPTRPAGTFSWVGNEMRYTLTNKLAAKTRYTVKLGPGVKSATGVTRASAFSWTFTTGATTSAPATVTIAAAPSSVGAQLTLNLSAAANVRVQVRNLAGREVAVVNAGDLDAGVHSVLWNGKSRTGTKVPAGMYLLEVAARSADGRQSKALASLRTGR